MPPRDGSRTAARAGLRYVNDESTAGITRHGAPGHFWYKRPDGQRVREKTILKRIRALAIPPAWKNVWIALSPMPT